MICCAVRGGKDLSQRKGLDFVGLRGWSLGFLRLFRGPGSSGT